MGCAGGRLGVAWFGLWEGDDEPDDDEDDGRGGDSDREIESAWIAFSTFLKPLFHAKEEGKRFGSYFSNSSCVILDNDVWSMVSMNETAPIYAKDEFHTGFYRQNGTEGTYQTGQVIASLTLEL